MHTQPELSFTVQKITCLTFSIEDIVVVLLSFFYSCYTKTTSKVLKYMIYNMIATTEIM
jgi:hypothetical protein